MGTITGQNLLEDISSILNDAGLVGWTTDDIYSAVTEAMRTIIMLRPDANPQAGNITLTPYQFNQSLPAGGIVLSRIIRNRGAAGNVAGKSITLTEKSVFDQALPGWMTHTTDNRIRNYLYDMETPRIFQVYPIPTAALKVEAIWGAAPDVIADADDTICIDDTHGPAIKEWALFRLQSMEIEGASINLALTHQTNFYNLMGTKMSNQITGLKLRGDI